MLILVSKLVVFYGNVGHSYQEGREDNIYATLLQSKEWIVNIMDLPPQFPYDTVNVRHILSIFECRHPLALCDRVYLLLCSFGDMRMNDRHKVKIRNDEVRL